MRRRSTAYSSRPRGHRSHENQETLYISSYIHTAKEIKYITYICVRQNTCKMCMYVWNTCNGVWDAYMHVKRCNAEEKCKMVHIAGGQLVSFHSFRIFSSSCFYNSHLSNPRLFYYAYGLERRLVRAGISQNQRWECMRRWGSMTDERGGGNVATMCGYSTRAPSETL